MIAFVVFLCLISVHVHGKRTVVLDTSNAASGNPDVSNAFTLGGGAASWASLIPSGQGYMKDLRTGNPDGTGTFQVNEASIGPPCGNPDDNVGCVPTKGDYLVSITFQYSYIIGYCSGDNPRCLPQKHNPQISMYIQPEWPYGPKNSTTEEILVYQGGPVTDGPFNGSYLNYNDCRHTPSPQCYSPPITVSAPYINLFHPKGASLKVLFKVQNNKRNLQIAFKDKVGLTLTLNYLNAPVKAPRTKSSAEGILVLGVGAAAFSVYCAVGMMYMAKVKGESGRHMVPNAEFWQGVPGLAKDGCSFSLKKVLGWKVAWHSMQRYEEL